jgi:hypothetical protein
MKRRPLETPALRNIVPTGATQTPSSAAGRDGLGTQASPRVPKLSPSHATEPPMSLQQFKILAFTLAELADAVDARR